MTVEQIFDITIEGWGILILILAGITYLAPGFKVASEKKLFHLEIVDILVLLSDMFAWIYRGNTTELGYYIERFSNFFNYIFNFVLIVVFAQYVSFFIKKDLSAKLYSYTMQVMSLLGIALAVSNLFTGWVYYFDAENNYVRGPGAVYSMSIGVIAMLINGVIIFFNYKEMTPARAWSFWSYLIIPLIAMLVQMKVFGISFTNISYTIAIIIAFFVTIVERGSMMVNQEREMHEMKNKLVLSQIQPHFIFNSLSTIYYLCKKEPKLAQDAIGQFAEFLRVNLDSLSQEYPVSFEQEMHHVENYLMLEQLRFNEKLLIEYDIQATEFKVPALSIQPLVENAVKYGISKKIGGGTVKLSSHEYEDRFEVIVEDDGMGYDVNIPKEDGRTHIGIDNVRARLEEMVNGTLEIKSKLNVGTKATITIPKEEKNELH